VLRSKTPTISLEEAKTRFEEWRQNRKGRAAIPDELWSTAAELAQKEGVSRTATELHLEWSELKRRVTATAEVSQPKAPPAFVELVAPRAEAVSECTIELEGRRCKLRIHLKSASACYLAALSRELVESAS
jgi:hypothetical protein